MPFVVSDRYQPPPFPAPTEKADRISLKSRVRTAVMLKAHTKYSNHVRRAAYATWVLYAGAMSCRGRSSISAL